MATDRAKLTKRRALAFKIETTTGSQEALVAADANIDAMEPEIRHTDEGTEREGSSLSPRPKIQGGLSGELSFRNHLSGAGGGIPPMANLFACAGFKNTGGVLSPLTATDNGNTGTFGLFKDGIFKSLFGVALDCTLRGEQGKPVECSWTGRGKRAKGNVNGPRDRAMITPAYIDVIPPVLRGVTFLVEDTAYRLPGFELALGNDVQMREDITDESAYHAAQVVDHARRLTISPEMLPKATVDWDDIFENAEQLALEIVIGEDAGNIITIEAPKIQIFQPPADEDRNKKYHQNLVFQFNQDADAGDDELIITFDTTSA